MPFVVQCPYCQIRARVPDRAMGGSGKCVRCGNYFTLTPAEDQHVPELVGSPVEPHSSDLEPASMGAAIAEAASAYKIPTVPDEPDEEDVDAAPARPASVFATNSSAPSGGSSPAWINGIGAAAFVLGSAALLAASFDSIRVATIPLTLIGLLLVVIQILKRPKRWRSRDVLWLLAGGGICAAVLATALFNPHLLNRNWGRDFRVEEPDPLQLFLVSRDGKVTGSALTEADWVDASKHAIRQGDLHVTLEKVAVQAPPVTGPDKTKQPHLLITVRLANVGRLSQLMYERVKGPPILRDDQGQTYALRTFEPPNVVERQVLKEILSPNRRIEDLWIFEPPDPGAAHLELELPSSIWGGKGTCKFRIPREMFSGKKSPGKN